MSIRTAYAAIFVFGLIAAPPTSFSQDNSERAVEQYSCKEVMRESGVQRNAAIAFLHGFILGKSGQSKFNLETMTKQTDQFIDFCLDNPKEKAVSAMQKIKS